MFFCFHFIGSKNYLATAKVFSPQVCVVVNCDLSVNKWCNASCCFWLAFLDLFNESCPSIVLVVAHLNKVASAAVAFTNRWSQRVCLFGSLLYMLCFSTVVVTCWRNLYQQFNIVCSDDWCLLLSSFYWLGITVIVFWSMVHNVLRYCATYKFFSILKTIID